MSWRSNLPGLAPTRALLGMVSLLFVVSASGSAFARERPADLASSTLSARDSALHVLDRLGFGPRPGDVERVARMGVMSWVEWQLAAAPAADPGLRRAERGFDILNRDRSQLASLFVEEQRHNRERQRAIADSARVRPAAAMGAAPALATGASSAPTALPPGMTMSDASKSMSVPSPASVEPMAQLANELPQLSLVRAVDADQQLREVMTEFWLNHFNVFFGKGQDRYLLPSWVEQVIRPRALGRFADLLAATAQDPAMLFYLDNVESIAPHHGGAVQDSAERRRARGLNENYARELLELHTLGVDGGYTQQDVIEVARIFTGWGMAPPDKGGGFVYRDAVHDTLEKRVLGMTFPAGHHQDEGLTLLAALARQPVTIHHVCLQLCTRLVADDPPADCVDAAVAAWKASDGDIREVVRGIVRSPGFWSPRALRTKFKTPYRYVVSAVRALAAEPDTTGRLAQQVARLGEPIYLQPSPAGYPERQDEWLNSGALLARMNFAVALAGGRIPGVAVELDDLVPLTSDYDQLVADVDHRVLNDVLTAATLRTIREQLRDVPNAAEARVLAIGLALGGPEFQRQ